VSEQWHRGWQAVKKILCSKPRISKIIKSPFAESLLIDVTWRQSPSSNSLVENFLLHRKIDPLFRRIRIDPQSAKIKENILLVLCHALAFVQVLLPRGYYHFHPEFIRMTQILVQMPPVRTVLQKDQTIVAFMRPLAQSGIRALTRHPEFGSRKGPSHATERCND